MGYGVATETSDFRWAPGSRSQRASQAEQAGVRVAPVTEGVKRGEKKEMRKKNRIN